MTHTQTESGDHAALMDQTYRYQRLFYDLTRRYYLLGRDHLISRLDPPRHGKVLEIACGTGRNMALTAKRYPECLVCGLDISSEMLRSAGAKMSSNGLSGRTKLAEADACTFDPAISFGVEKFDRIILSYSISMIPDWQKSLRQAVQCLAPRGELHVVDFGTQDRLPSWFKGTLRAWLDRFHVTPRDGFKATLETLASDTAATCEWRPLYRDYAQYGVLKAR